MAKTERLMGVGMSDELSKRVGFFMPGTLNTGQTINGPGNFIAVVSGESLQLGSNFDLGDIVKVLMVTTGSVYPAASDTIHFKATASALVVTADVTKEFIKVSVNSWIVLGGVTA